MLEHFRILKNLDKITFPSFSMSDFLERQLNDRLKNENFKYKDAKIAFIKVWVGHSHSAFC